MSGVNQPSAAGGDNPSQGSADPSTVTVKHTPEELAQRLVETAAENKKFRQRATAVSEENERLQKQLADLQANKLKEQGEFKSLYEQEKTRAEQLEIETKKTKATFAFKAVTSEFAAEAAKVGCRNTSDLIKLATADGLISELEVSSEDYSVTQESLKTVLAKAQQKYGYLYGQPTPGINDGVPSNSGGQTPPAKLDQSTLKNLKMDELIQLAHKIK